MEKIFPVVAAVIGLIVAFCLASWIKKTDEGTDRMKEIAGYIREGAMAFLAREYKTMVIVVVVLFLVIGFALQLDNRCSLLVRRGVICFSRFLRHEGRYAR